MAEACFGNNEANSYIYVSADNRVHLWDTNTTKELRTFVEKQHLSHSYTCSTWKEGKKNNLGIFAAGCSDGTIVVWDLTRGIVVKTLGKINESPIPTSLCFSNDSKSIIVGSNQAEICQYEILTGEKIHSFKAGKKGVLKICLNPRVDVVAAGGSSVRVIDVKSGRKRKLEAQFSGGIVALSFTQCGRYLAVAGSGSREVLLFDVQAGAEATPLVAVAVSGEPKSFVVRSITSDSGDRIEVLCVFEDVDACFIRYTVQGDSEVIKTAVCKIITGSVTMAGRFGNSTGGKLHNEVTLATGQKSSPVFSTVEIVDADGVFKESVTVASRSSGGKSSDAKEKSGEDARSSTAAVILGPHDTISKKRPLLAEDVEENGKHARMDVVAEELTMEQRLEILSNSLADVEKITRPAQTSSSALSSEEQGPSANSLVVIVEQALQSGDDALLEQGLACSDVNIINGTAKRLAPGRVVQLLRKLVAKFEKRPSRGLLLTRWLAALLKFHTSFLISVPDLSSQLAGLSQMLEHRLSSYSKLAALGGRLDLLMSQITTLAEADNGTIMAKRSATTPRQVYKE